MQGYQQKSYYSLAQHVSAMQSCGDAGVDSSDESASAYVGLARGPKYLMTISGLSRSISDIRDWSQISISNGWCCSLRTDLRSLQSAPVIIDRYHASTRQSAERHFRKAPRAACARPSTCLTLMSNWTSSGHFKRELALRGMLTSARIADELRPAGLDWISALRAPQIKALVEAGAIQLSLFDTQNLVEIAHPDYPGERLVCCHNPALADERARKRDELLAGPEELATIAAATRRERRPLHGKDRIALRVGKVINHYKMAKHFTLTITDEAFTFTRNHQAIAAEAALDGIYLLRTSLPTDTLDHGDVVARYKNLADVERFFRTLNGELDVQPIRHRLAERVRAHMFLRMLSYYISWHMKQALAPILFVDNDKPAAAAKRADPVAAAQRSDQALAKAARKRTPDGAPVHSFTSLLADLATICANHIQPASDMPAFTKITTPTALQRRAFELLDVSHHLGYT